MLPVPGQPFFLFLLSDELRDERYDYASKCHRFRDPTSKFRVVSTQEKEERRRSRPFFDISKRLSYFYLVYTKTVDSVFRAL